MRSQKKEKEEELGGERRQFERVDLNIPLQYRLREGENLIGCLTCDLGEGGVRFKANDFLPLNTELLVQFEPESFRPVSLRGHVKWVQMIPHSDWYQVGMEFGESQSSVDSKEGVSQYIQSRRND